MSESKKAMTKEEQAEWMETFITRLEETKEVKKEAISILLGVVERDEIQPTEESAQILEDVKRATKTLSEATEREYGFLTDQEEKLRAGGIPTVIRLIDLKKEVDSLNPEIDHAIAVFDTRLKRLLEEAEQPETKQRHKKRKRTANDGLTLTLTKVDSAIFGQLKGLAPFTAEQYKGKKLPIDQGSNSTDTTLITLNNEAIAKGIYGTIAAPDRIYMEAFNSIVEKNPNKWEVNGSELLERIGYEKPLRKGHAETMQEALNACIKFTDTKVAIDTTKTSKSKRRHAKEYMEVSLMPMVFGVISVEQWQDEEEEDMVRDFTVKLASVEGSTDARDSLPLLSYAKAAGEVLPTSRELTKVPGLRGMNERRILFAMIRHTSTEGLKHPDTFTWDTLLMQCGITKDKHTTARAKKTVKKILDYWASVSRLEGWEYTKDGFKLHGFISDKQKYGE